MRLREEGVHAKDLPMKPKHPLKPKVDLEIIADDMEDLIEVGSGSEGSGDNDNDNE